eukprot:TRINITY_DN15192_c0_g1_i1.p1 TRINITY_DN15192_c0_g1~~TRINITY_DN15192_c0_g1_i1.p1  ORF type:complete len:1232 (-),score=243.02 TRINITY_DN15192_c0_g1_i1:40-3735(-)
MSIEEADMKELGLKFGARRKLSLRLKALRLEAEQSQTAQKDGKRSSPAGSNSAAGSAEKVEDPESVLLGMGFEKAKVDAALQSAEGDFQLAVAMLVSCQESGSREIPCAPSCMGRSFAASSSASGGASSTLPSPSAKGASSSLPGAELPCREEISISSSSQPSLKPGAESLEQDEAWQTQPAKHPPLSPPALKLRQMSEMQDEAWQTPPAKRPRLSQAALKLRQMPEMSEGDSESVLFNKRVAVDYIFARKALATYTAPRKEKHAGQRGKVEVTKPQPEWKGVLRGCADSEELEATLGLPSASLFASLDVTTPSLSEWNPLQIPSRGEEDDEETVCDFKRAMEAAAGINAVTLTKKVSMGTQLMHQEVMKSGKPWLDPHAPYMNASPNEFRWTSKVRWSCRHPTCQAMDHGGWFYDHSDAARKGGPPKDHEMMFKHPADFVLFAWDKSTKLPMSVTYKHIGRNWREVRSAQVEVSFKAALAPLLKLCDFAAYWPADRQRAHWRVISRPITESPEVEPVMLGRYAAEAKKAKATPMALEAKDVESNIGNVKPLIIPSSSTTPPAKQPPFQVPLKLEQLRALAWMLKREGLGAGGTYLSTQLVERRFAGSDVCLQLRVEREYSSSRGGILAHQMGFGKTALVIALIAQSKISRTRGPLAAGTLIVTPGSSALHHQWQTELKKFLGNDHAGLTILSISSMHEFNATSLESLQSADVVIVNGDFFLADEYRKAFDASFGAQATEKGYEALRYARMRARAVAGPMACFLEQFDWDRVVFDEFHKMVNESKTGLQAWRALHELHSASRWGLTGTPDVTTALSVSEMAAMLHVFVPPDSRLEAQRFIDVWVRADGWDSDDIKMDSHMIEVTPSASERTLYLATKRMLEAQGTSGEASAQTQLLQLCSHFSPEELVNVGSCDAAVKMAWLDQKKAVEEQKGVVQMRSAALKAYKGHDASHARRLREGLEAAEARLLHVESAYAYFTSTLAFLERVKKGEEGALECPICLADFERAEELSVTRCGHVFCSGCLDETLSSTSTLAPDGSAKAACPTCRQMLCPVKDHDDISGLCFEASASKTSGPSISRYGTKIGLIIEQLRSIHSSGERVLIFVQWRQLLSKIASALDEANIPTLYLQGGVAEQQQTIYTFRVSEQVRTLLLAMEDDDSGLNLTCANHAFFVHPMDVRDRQVALACERQALGRIRRRGQSKNVHLYRFITKGTVEEVLAKQFHSEMMQAS